MDQLRESLRSFRLPSLDLSDRERVNFEGRWWKDKQASDMQAYSAALDLLELGGLQKKGAHMIHGLDIQQDDDTFTAKFLMPGVPFFKPTERYRFEEQTAIRRRDMRRGEQTCLAKADSGKVEVDMQWGSPCAGSVREVYTSPEPGVLRVESVTRVGNKEQRGLQIYRRHED